MMRSIYAYSQAPPSFRLRQRDNWNRNYIIVICTQGSANLVATQELDAYENDSLSSILLHFSRKRHPEGINHKCTYQ